MQKKSLTHHSNLIKVLKSKNTRNAAEWNNKSWKGNLWRGFGLCECSRKGERLIEDYFPCSYLLNNSVVQQKEGGKKGRKSADVNKKNF